MKRLINLLTLAIVITVMAGTASASNGFGFLSVGNDYFDRAGEVDVSNDGTNLTITFTAYTGWSMTETNLHVATSLTDVPQTKKGNPKIGNFDFSDGDAVQSTPTLVKYVIPLPAGSPLYIAAHAVVQKVVGLDPEGNPIIREETGWGACDNPSYSGNFPGGSWATYMIYYP